MSRITPILYGLNSVIWALLALQRDFPFRICLSILWFLLALAMYQSYRIQKYRQRQIRERASIARLRLAAVNEEMERRSMLGEDSAPKMHRPNCACVKCRVVG